MGITGINNTLKGDEKKPGLCPEAFTEIELSRFSGYAIGIDSSLWLFKAKSAALKDYYKSMLDPLDPINEETIIDNIVKQFYGFVFKLCNAGITPVWIFDGKTHPAKIACDARKAKRDVRKVDIEAERSRIRELSILERAHEIPNFVKKLLSCICITKKEIEAVKAEAEALGLPSFTAPHDGEIFASALSRQRLLIGVWTTDTDTYACGALLTFKGFSSGSYLEGTKVDVFVPAVVLDSLSITQEQFRDLCIMHECDFNKRIPGFGPASIVRALEKNSWDLDQVRSSDPTKDWESLNLEECREIFNGPCVDEYNIEMMKIDRYKWEAKLRTKLFEIEYPPTPMMVELV